MSPHRFEQESIMLDHLCKQLLAFYRRRPRFAFNCTLLAIMATFLVCLSLDALFDLGWRWWHVSPGGYERVMMGMTEREVVAVLGQPGGFEGYGDFLYPASTLSEYDRMWFRPMNGGWIVVMFNGNNRVVGKVLHFPGLNEQHFVGDPEG
jgi:hypothetical protein